VNGRKIELAIAEVEMLDPHLQESGDLSSNALRRPRANHPPLAQGVSAVDTFLGTTPLGLDSAHTPLFMVAPIVQGAALRRGHVFKLEVSRAIAAKTFPHPIDKARNIVVVFSSEDPPQQQGKRIFSLPPDAEVKPAILKNGLRHDGETRPTKDQGSRCLCLEAIGYLLEPGDEELLTAKVAIIGVAQGDSDG